MSDLATGTWHSQRSPTAWVHPLPDQTVDLVMGGVDLDVVSLGPGAAEWTAQAGIVRALRDELRQRKPGWWSLPPLYVRCVRMASADGVNFLLSIVPPRPELREALHTLTPSQLQVAEYAASGATVKEIATALGRSPETVRSHIKAVYAALWVGNRVELAATLRRPAISYGA